VDLEGLLKDKLLNQKDYLIYGQIENEHCKRDASYFCEEYAKIEDRDSKVLAIPFKLWDGQKKVVDLFKTHRLVQILKARQLGLTWLALVYAVWNIIYKGGFLVIALSKTEVDAKELARRVEFILRYLPNWIINKKEWESTALSVTIKKHKEPSVFQAFPAGQESGRSFTANIVILDEWAKQQWAREIWQSAFPTINRPTGGQVIGLSTIERGTLFEDLWMKERSGFAKIFLPWNTDPRRTPEWYENTRNAMGDGVMAEYPATPEEAFSIPKGAFFSEFRADIHVKEPIKPEDWYTKYRSMDYGTDCFACYWYYIDAYGYARIYREVHKEGLVISQAAYELHKASGAEVPETVEEWDALETEQKQMIAESTPEIYTATYAPIDLFHKSNHTGKAGSDVWFENGVSLISTNNKLKQGCVTMKEWLHPIQIKDEQTGEVLNTAKLTIDKDCAPNLVHSLLNIQKDKNDAEIFADHPHPLTHSICGVMAFCTEYSFESIAPEKPQPVRFIDEDTVMETSNRAVM
jgi:hypothetical protein